MTASAKIDALIAGIPDWRGKVFADLRKTVLSADPDIVEEWKWRGTPVWSKDGIIAVANAHKDKVKMTFHSGAKLADPDGVFNAGLDGNQWRAIDLYEGDKFNKPALKALVRTAIAFNQSKKKKKAPMKVKARKKPYFPAPSHPSWPGKSRPSISQKPRKHNSASGKWMAATRA